MARTSGEELRKESGKAFGDSGFKLDWKVIVTDRRSGLSTWLDRGSYSRRFDRFPMCRCFGAAASR